MQAISIYSNLRKRKLNFYIIKNTYSYKKRFLKKLMSSTELIIALMPFLFALTLASTNIFTFVVKN